MEATYDGTLELAAGLALDGLLSLKAPSVRDLGKLDRRPDGRRQQDPGALSLSSSLAGADGRVSLSRLTATLGDTSLEGALTIETKGERPHLSGDLHALGARPRPHPHPSRARSAARSARRRQTQADPIDDIPAAHRSAGESAAQVRGSAKPRRRRLAIGATTPSISARSASPMPTLTLSVDRLVHKDVKTGPSRLSLKLEDKVANITLEDMQLYDGRGRGMLRLDGSGEVPVDRRQPDARWRLRAAVAQGRAGLRLARGAQHHRHGACRPGRLRAADDRDLERQGGHDDRQRRHRRHRRRQDAAQHRAGPLGELEHLAGREDGLSASSPARYTIANGVAQQPRPAAREQ